MSDECEPGILAVSTFSQCGAQSGEVQVASQFITHHSSFIIQNNDRLDMVRVRKHINWLNCCDVVFFTQNG